MGRKTLPERVEAQRHKVLEKAAELFAEKGFHATSVDDIAKALNLTKGSVYYYIPSKEEILFQVNSYAHDLLLGGITAVVNSTESPDVKLHKIVTTHILTCCSEMSVVSAMLQMHFVLTGEARDKLVEKRSMYDQMLRQVIKDGIDQGIFIQCDPSVVSFFLLGSINYTPNWYKEDGRLSKQAIANMFADLMLRSLLVNQPAGENGRISIQDVTAALSGIRITTVD